MDQETRLHAAALGDQLTAVVNAYLTKHKLGGTVHYDMKLKPAPQATSVTVNRKELLKALTAVKVAVSREQARYYMNGVLLQVRGEVVNVVATDGHRLIHGEVKCSKARHNVECIVDDRRVKGRMRALTGLKILIETLKGWRAQFIDLAISADACSVNGHRVDVIESTYPDWTRVLPQTDTVQGSIIMPVEQVKAFCKAALNENKSTYFTGVKFVNNNNYGECHDLRIQITAQTGQVQFGINERYLLDFVGNAKGDVTIVQYDHDGPLDLQLSDRYRRVFMPMRV